MLTAPVSQDRMAQAPVAAVDPKALLRAHVDQLPFEKQLEFVDLALHLIESRTCSDAAPTRAKLVN